MQKRETAQNDNDMRSRNARTLMVRWSIRRGNRAYRWNDFGPPRSDGGLLENDSARPTLEMLRRKREFLRHNGPLSEVAIERLRCYFARDKDVTDRNRAEFRGSPRRG